MARRRRYSGEERWTIIRALIDRDGSACRYCRRPLSPNAMTIDHVLALGKGGDSRLENMVLACRPCNVEKRDLSLSEFIRRGGHTCRYDRGWSCLICGREPGYTARATMRRRRAMETIRADG